MSVDAEKLQMLPWALHYLWASPLMVVLSTYFLWQQIGASCLTGISFLLVLLPITSVLVASKMKSFQVGI